MKHLKSFSKISESVHHATYFLWAVKTDYSIESATANDDLAADAWTGARLGYYDHGLNKADYLYVSATTDIRWKDMAQKAIDMLKSGKSKKEIFEVLGC